MDSNLADTEGFREKRILTIERVIIYGLLAVFFCLSVPWEICPYPVSLLSVLSTGAGGFLETRLFLYIGMLVLAYAWVLSSYLRGKPCFKHTLLDIPILLFLVASLLSMGRLTDVHASIDGFFLVLSYFIFFYLIISCTQSFADIKLLIYAFVGTGALLSLYGIYQYGIGFKELGKYIATQSLAIDIPNRVFAIFISPNHLAGYLIMVIPLAFVVSLNAKKGWMRITMLTCLVLMVDCLFLTYSRGGILSLGLGLMVLLVGYGMRKQKDAFLNLIGVVILVAVTVFLITKAGAVLSSANPSYSALSFSQGVLSVQGRLMLWKGALNIIKANPLIGTGVGTFASIYPLFQYGGLYSTHAHNIYLEIFSETGLLGIISFISIFVFIIGKAVHSTRQQQGVLYELSLALLAGALGFMVHNAIDFEWSMAAAGLLFWGIVGLIFSCAQVAESDQSNLAEGSKCGQNKAGGLTVGAIVSVITLVTLCMLSSAAFALYYSSQAQTLYRQKRGESALTSLEQASRLDPLNGDYWNNLAQLYLQKAKTARSSTSKERWMIKAINSASKAIRLRPDWAAFYANLGEIYDYKGEEEKAVEYFGEAQKLYPKNPHYLLLQGEFYYYQKDYKKAVNEYKKALSLQKYYVVWYPGNTAKDFELAHLGLGRSYLKLKKFTQAEGEFKAALKLNSENDIAKSELKKLSQRRRQ